MVVAPVVLERPDVEVGQRPQRVERECGAVARDDQIDATGDHSARIGIGQRTELAGESGECCSQLDQGTSVVTD